MYHEIYRPEERDRLRGLTNPAYNTELNYFRGQMAWLRANNIKTLTIDDSSHKSYLLTSNQFA